MNSPQPRQGAEDIEFGDAVSGVLSERPYGQVYDVLIAYIIFEGMSNIVKILTEPG